MGPSVFATWAEAPEVAALRQTSGAVFRCRVCSLVFRSPAPSAAELEAAYRAVPVECWSYHEPSYWHRLRDFVRTETPNNRVLDVGCFRGDFLSFLGAEIEAFGIEPNPAARERAAARGVRLVGADAMDRLSGYESYFGAILLMDVAEHLHDPAVTFEHLARYVAPGGILVVLTGNADHFLPRYSLPYYWYMSYPIHLVYLGIRYFRWLCANRGWRMVSRFRYAHEESGLLGRIRDYETGIRLLLWGRYLRGGVLAPVASRLPPLRGIARSTSPQPLFRVSDHMCVILRR